MVYYGYVRVSSDKQTLENQHFAINSFAEAQKIKIDKWVEETISSRKPLEKRQLGRLLSELNQSDIIIVTEISRLARNLYELANILQMAINKNVAVISIKENYTFKNDLQSKIMAYTFGLAAEIERTLISTRTKMSLEKLKEKHIKLGRPFGAKSKSLKLTKSQQKIQKLLASGISQAKIAKIMNVDPTTLCRFLKRNKN